MNRLRRAYLTIAPSLEPYFTTGHHDDERGLVTTYMLHRPTQLEQLAVDSCTTKAPCGGQAAGPSPVDRRKQGLKRSTGGCCVW